MSEAVSGDWPAHVSSSSSEASWRKDRHRFSDWSHSFVHSLGLDSMPFGVADRPKLESEYTFNKTLLERRPIERIESYMYFVTVTY